MLCLQEKQLTQTTISDFYSTICVWINDQIHCAVLIIFTYIISVKAVGNLVVRALDSRQKGLGSMPQNTLRVHTECVLVKSVGPKVLWTESRVQRTGEYFPPLQPHGKIGEVEIGGVTIYRPFGEFRRANSYRHLYGAQAQGQRQAYF
ncbi:uncharacterized protein TNCV_2436211 [Trichonephila clavipes]|nr:uncharacterized protein TNCV_2436211 [Trichonephila clavipes]